MWMILYIHGSRGRSQSRTMDNPQLRQTCPVQELWVYIENRIVPWFQLGGFYGLVEITKLTYWTRPYIYPGQLQSSHNEPALTFIFGNVRKLTYWSRPKATFFNRNNFCDISIPYGRGLSSSKNAHPIRSLADRDEPCPYGEINVTRLVDWIARTIVLGKQTLRRLMQNKTRKDGVYLRPKTLIQSDR